MNKRDFKKEYKKAWNSMLEEKKFDWLLTIKLPKTNPLGYKRTRKQSKAKKLYRKLIQEIEAFYTGSSNNWNRYLLDYIGIFEHGKSGFWHIHIGIISDKDPEVLGYELEWVIKQINNKYYFGERVIDLRPVYYKPGAQKYLLKEIEPENYDVWDEGSYILMPCVWFNSKYFKYGQPKKLNLRRLQKIIYVAFHIKSEYRSFVSNLLNRRKKTSLHLSSNTRKFIKQSATNFETLYLRVRFIKIPMIEGVWFQV